MSTHATINVLIMTKVKVTAKDKWIVKQCDHASGNEHDNKSQHDNHSMLLAMSMLLMIDMITIAC